MEKIVAKPTFHLSVDDVLPSLLDISYKDLALTENAFFKTLKLAWELYGVRTGLHLFYNHVADGLVKCLSEVRRLDDEISENWIYFGPHALDKQTPPHAQTIAQQILTFDKIIFEIARIANENRSKSIRLHHYSECYENGKYFVDNGINEIFATDKPIGLHRFGSPERLQILKNGFIRKNGLKITRTHFRIEDLANANVTKSEFLAKARECLNLYNRIVIYSHEYEHSRKNVNEMYLNVAKWLTEDLQLECERP